MSTALITREFNGFVIQQRQTDGCINATAMCRAFGKEIKYWLRLNSTLELVTALAKRLGTQASSIPDKSILSENPMIYDMYPTLIISKRGAPETGGSALFSLDVFLLVF